MRARRLVIIALMGATAFPLAGAVTEALPAPPAGAAIARPVWTHHAATLRAGRHLVVTLRRTRPSVCTLRVSGPKHAARHWTYASGSGLIQFDLAASPAVTPGVWTLVATCVPHGTTAVERVSTTVRVLGHKAGWASLVGARGPLYQVPVGSGLVTKPTPGSATLTVDPTLGGRGGDPGNDYPWKNLPQDSRYDPWREDVRECTSFAAWALYSRNGFTMPFYANAIDWGAKAAALGYAVNGTPQVGSIAWETKPPWGHVAWVSAVSGGKVLIEEYNYSGNGTHDTRWVAQSAFQYIHFKDITAPAPPAAPIQPTTNPQQPTTTPIQPTTNPQQPTTTPIQPTTNPQQPTTTPSGTSTGGGSGGSSGSGSGGSTPPPSSPPPAPTTYSETAGGVAHTWTNYTNAGGNEGPSIGAGQTVQISCRLTGFTVADGNNWWYRIASSPWNNSYYVSADAFYNDRATSGSLHGTPFVDPAVASC